MFIIILKILIINKYIFIYIYIYIKKDKNI